MEARLVFPARRRGHACRGHPRMQDGAPERRPLRRLDARQDRGRRPGCRRSSWTGSTPTPGRSSSPAAAATASCCSEAGFVMDDGVVGRLAPDRFHVTTTTGGAPRVLNHMEDYLQTEFPELKVWLTSTTEQWAVIAVQGPKAREIIAPLVEGIDLSDAGDAAYERARGQDLRRADAALPRVASPASSASRSTCRPTTATRSGKRSGPTGEAWRLPYGTETMHVLRAEKGYIIVGQETDGTVTPDDVGLDWAIGKTKTDFVGKRSLTRPDLVAARPQAARRPADHGPEDRAGGGRADRRRSEAADPDDDDRPRHLVLLVGKLRPLDRAGAGRRRARRDRRRRCYVPMPTERSRSRSSSRCSSTKRESASMAKAAKKAVAEPAPNAGRSSTAARCAMARCL